MKTEKMMKQLFLTSCLLPLLSINALQAQESQNDFKPHGKLSGKVFGDYYYKAHADSLERGNYQYSGIAKDENAFELRRVQLGYQYHISKKFTGEVLVELDGATTSKKMGLYIKYANLQWKNIFPNSNLIVGATQTPTFSTVTEKYWEYRHVEKMAEDMHGSTSYDLGVRLEGSFDKKKNYGYNLMVGNGTGVKAENNRSKKVYSEVYGKFLDKKLVVDLYTDYERKKWEDGLKQSSSLWKIFAAYSGEKITVGAGIYLNRFQNGIGIDNPNNPQNNDTLSGTSLGFSSFVRGPIVQNKLAFFARYDYINPYIQSMNNELNYEGLHSNLNPNVKESFITAGIDYSPVKNVHLIPNIWYQSFSNKNSINSNRDYDLAYRLSIYYKF